MGIVLHTVLLVLAAILAIVGTAGLASSLLLALLIVGCLAGIGLSVLAGREKARMREVLGPGTGTGCLADQAAALLRREREQGAARVS